jgi:hypothetical protein
MANLLHFGAIVAGTTTILSAQLFGCLNSFQVLPFGHSGDLGFRLAVFSNLPANAQSNPQNIPLANKDLIFSQTTKARISFIPPADKNSRSSQGSGARGCQQSLPVNLVTLLIPSKDYIGQTTSGHPTFFWHLSQPISVPLRFTLVEPGVAKPLFVKQIDSPQVGTMQLALPKDRPELVAGRSYGWSVSLICNSRRPLLIPISTAGLSAYPQHQLWSNNWQRLPQAVILLDRRHHLGTPLVNALLLQRCFAPQSTLTQGFGTML